jgi:hypothetical protein
MGVDLADSAPSVWQSYGFADCLSDTKSFIRSLVYGCSGVRIVCGNSGSSDLEFPLALEQR